jgi:hypothetical protein
LADGPHHLLVLLEAQGGAGGDVHQHAARAGELDAFQQRAGHGFLGGDAGAINAGGHGGTHHRLAHLAHHRAHVLEVDVDQARHVDDLGDAADGVAQHVVGGLEGLEHADLVAEHFLELLVEDHDQRVDMARELGHAFLGQAHALALVLEGLGHHGHGEDAQFARHLGDHRAGTGAGAAAHAGGDEDHVRAGQRLGDALALQLANSRAFSGLPPAPRPGPSCSLTWALLFFSACESVLQQMNSTPPTPSRIM